MKSYLSDEFFGRLETLALNMKLNLAGFFGGKHLVKTYGQTVEFADYREYMLGDDIRRIDWNLYSRFEKYFLKLFTDERQMHIQVFLDCSGSMSMNANKAAYAVGVAGAMGFLAVHNMDKLSFNLMKRERAENPFGTIVGKTAFFRAIRELESIKFEGDTDIASAIMTAQNTGTNDGLTVIISDFLTESNWKKAVDYLRHKKRQVLLIQVLTKEELDPLYSGRLDLIDAESMGLEDSRNLRLRVTRPLQQAYEEELNLLIDDLKTFARSREADFITVNSEKPIETVLFSEILKVGLIG